jgi:hypothetical protein
MQADAIARELDFMGPIKRLLTVHFVCPYA